MVFFDGVVFEKFGIMSGGGGKFRGGWMGIVIKDFIVFCESMVSVEKDFEDVRVELLVIC